MALWDNLRFEEDKENKCVFLKTNFFEIKFDNMTKEELFREIYKEELRKLK